MNHFSQARKKPQDHPMYAHSLNRKKSRVYSLDETVGKLSMFWFVLIGFISLLALSVLNWLTMQINTEPSSGLSFVGLIREWVLSRFKHTGGSFIALSNIDFYMWIFVALFIISSVLIVVSLLKFRSKNSVLIAYVGFILMTAVLLAFIMKWISVSEANETVNLTLFPYTALICALGVMLFIRSRIVTKNSIIIDVLINWRRMFRLSLYENKAKNKEMVLGRLWNYINPALQILVYWLVFSIGLQHKPLGNIPYVVWLTVGILYWTTINTAIMHASESLNASAGILKSIAIPLAVIPAKSILSAWVEHLYMLIIIFLVIIANGLPVTWSLLGIFYYYAAGYCFTFAFSLITSSITVVFKDFTGFLNPILRFVFYFSNVVWEAPTESMGRWSYLFRYNPFAHLVDGYRYAFLYDIPFYTHYKSMVYFWTVTIVMFLFGSYLHHKLKDRFIDMI